MNNLLFTALIIALLYYFFYYLPQQKQIVSNSNPLLTHTQFTQTDPILKKQNDETTVDCPGPQDNQEIDNLKQQLTESKDSAKQKDEKNQELTKEITNLQSQIRDLAKRPLKPTNSKTTQTDELTTTLDTLIKDIQQLNNEL